MSRDLFSSLRSEISGRSLVVAALFLLFFSFSSAVFAASLDSDHPALHLAATSDDIFAGLDTDTLLKDSIRLSVPLPSRGYLMEVRIAPEASAQSEMGASDNKPTTILVGRGETLAAIDLTALEASGNGTWDKVDEGQGGWDEGGTGGGFAQPDPESGSKPDVYLSCAPPSSLGSGKSGGSCFLIIDLGSR